MKLQIILLVNEVMMCSRLWRESSREGGEGEPLELIKKTKEKVYDLLVKGKVRKWTIVEHIVSSQFWIWLVFCKFSEFDLLVADFFVSSYVEDMCAKTWLSMWKVVVDLVLCNYADGIIILLLFTLLDTLFCCLLIKIWGHD